MKYQILTSLLLLNFSGQALAKKYMGYMGGSGDPAGTSTIFDAKISAVGAYSRNSGSETSIAFDGGHSQTESILTSSFPGQNVSDFTGASYESMIAGYEAGIRNGTITSGDQLLLLIDSHGAENQPPARTHAISSGRGTAVDLNNLSGSDTVSLDRIAGLSRLAEEKGVRLGIIDMSCHSGASLPLANSKTCVITASGPQSYAYGGDDRRIFSTRMIDGMTPGKNLEDVFLNARSQAIDVGFPMISTPEARAAQDQLYPLLRRYINYSDAKADKFNREIENSVSSQSCLQENADLQKIFDLSTSIESVTEGISFADFRAALTEYQNYRRTIQGELDRMGVSHLKDKRRVCGPPTICYDLDIGTIVNMDSNARLADNQAALASATTEEKRVSAQNWINYFQNVRTIREEIIRTYPGIDRQATYLRDNLEMKNMTLELANKVARESRKVYSALYQKSEASNPCKDFVL